VRRRWLPPPTPPWVTPVSAICGTGGAAHLAGAVATIAGCRYYQDLGVKHFCMGPDTVTMFRYHHRVTRIPTGVMAWLRFTYVFENGSA
jgi:hypothetical protein